jgi:hypothetical protein
MIWSNERSNIRKIFFGYPSFRTNSVLSLFGVIARFVLAQAVSSYIPRLRLRHFSRNQLIRFHVWL